MDTGHPPVSAPGHKDHHPRSLLGRLKHAWRSLHTRQRRQLRNLLIAILVSLMAAGVALLLVQFL